MAEGTLRAEITTRTLHEALSLASRGGSTINFADTRQQGLILRVRDKSISWLVKTRRTTRRLGSPPEMLIRDARTAAALMLGEMKSGRLPPARETAVPAVDQLSSEAGNEPPASGWTLGDLFLRYEDDRAEPRVVGGKLREPAWKTLAEIDLAFRRTAWDPFRSMRLDKLSERHVSDAVHAIQTAISPHQARKALMHVRRALEWAAAAQRASLSGLGGVQRWWRLVELDEPSGEVAARMVSRARPTANSEFKIEHLGIALARHEDFCAARQGRERVSAAVKWGLWWVALTAMRRGAATHIRHTQVSFNDPIVPDDWALVKWPAEIMKQRGEFWLPAPPLGVTILRRAQQGWREEMERANRRNQDTSWIFTSNARVTRTGAKRDEPLSPYALTTHLTNMRGARSSGKTYRNQLADLPHFTLHTIRSCMTSWIADHIGEEAGAASKMLDHRTQQERDKADGMSPTTQRFYDVAQRIPAKTRVMRAWSNALIDAYEAAGGREVYPRSVMVNDSFAILPRTWV